MAITKTPRKLTEIVVAHPGYHWIAGRGNVWLQPGDRIVFFKNMIRVEQRID